MLFEQDADAFALARAIGIKRIERVMIERDGDALIAELGEDGDGVFER